MIWFACTIELLLFQHDSNLCNEKSVSVNEVGQDTDLQKVHLINVGLAALFFVLDAGS
jgi:hypothetical protein